MKKEKAGGRKGRLEEAEDVGYEGEIKCDEEKGKKKKRKAEMVINPFL